MDGILVVDGDGRILLANQRMLDLFEVPESLHGSRLDQSMLEHAVAMVKDGAAFLQKVQYLYAHPEMRGRDILELRNGTILDRFTSPVVGAGSKYYGRIWVFRDITENKSREDMLQQLSLAVEQSSVSVVITDPAGKISYVNRKFTDSSGYSADEVLGNNPNILKSGYSPADFYKNLWSTISQGKEWRGEFHNRKKNGELFWESATITPVTNGAGQITHYLAIKEDVTERRVLEGQLRQAQKLEAIGQLAAGIAHEINTPTQFVMDNLAFLKESWEAAWRLIGLYRDAIRQDQESSGETLAAITAAERECDLEFLATEIPRAIDAGLDGVRRVSKIVRAMKEFSHPDSGEKAMTDLNRSIESTITVARNEWKYVATVDQDLDPNLPMVLCFPGEINQVILNLLVNAAHAIKDRVKESEKGQITVSTRLRGDFAEMSVSDTGGGIPENIRMRIFEPFFTTKEVGKGTGQGLALAHNVVVKKLGGRIWFETEVGRGTTFFVHLPVSAID
jgi:PAS domain S-box-containing protein